MSAPRRSAALAAMLLIIVAFAGCGRAANAPSSAPLTSGDPFTSLHAVRTSEFPANNILAFDHTGTDPTAIAKLYDAIRVLQPFDPNAVYSCPADVGVLYHLAFTRTDGTQVTGVAKPDGCQYASVNGGTRGQILDEDGFWSLFAAAVGVPVSALDLTSSGS